MGFAFLAAVGAMVLMVIQSAIPVPGEDVIEEGDSIAGSDHDDRIYGDGADQMILPHHGDDFASGGGGDDTISDLPWDHEATMTTVGPINPDWGSDTFLGQAGDDRILANGGADEVSGGEGNDTINTVDLHPKSPWAPDLVTGDAGDDWLIGDDGDTLSGGEGQDFFSAVVEEDKDQPVLVTDFEKGETLEILLVDAGLFNPDGSLPTPELRDSSDGAILSVSGHDAVIFADAMARDLTGAVRVLDGR